MIVSLIRPYSSHTKTKTKRSCFYRLLGDPNSFIYVLTAGIKLFEGYLQIAIAKVIQKTLIWCCCFQVPNIMFRLHVDYPEFDSALVVVAGRPRVYERPRRFAFEFNLVPGAFGNRDCWTIGAFSSSIHAPMIHVYRSTSLFLVKNKRRSTTEGAKHLDLWIGMVHSILFL